MRVSCIIEEVDLDGDFGVVAGVEAACSRCGHITESFGTSDVSIRRCLVLLREECPKGERNFYFDEESHEND